MFRYDGEGNLKCPSKLNSVLGFLFSEFILLIGSTFSYFNCPCIGCGLAVWSVNLITALNSHQSLSNLVQLLKCSYSFSLGIWIQPDQMIQVYITTLNSLGWSKRHISCSLCGTNNVGLCNLSQWICSRNGRGQIPISIVLYE